MSDDLNNPHDTFFRAAFARPEVSSPFFQRYLPPGALAHLDLDTLSLEKDSFIDERLRKHRADLLFSVKGQAGQPVLIYLLLEHKSYQDRWTAFHTAIRGHPRTYSMNHWRAAITARHHSSGKHRDSRYFTIISLGELPAGFRGTRRSADSHQ